MDISLENWYVSTKKGCTIRNNNINYFSKTIAIAIPILTIFGITACKPDPHPRNPNYAIKKPKVIHTPSRKSLKKMVKDLQGSPYVWAEEGPNNFDCSGFTYYMYGSMGITIPRVSREQAKVGKKISIKQLQYGDLIFFATKRNSSKINHVGMYLGDGWFTHASTVKYEVVYSNIFTSSYYKKRVKVCRRYLPSEPSKISNTEPWSTTKSNNKTMIAMPKSISTKQLSTIKKAIVIKTEMKNIENVSSDGTFYVQIGSFLGKPKRSMLNTITRNGYSYKIIKFSKDGKKISKLLIGPYVKRSDAINILSRVKSNIQKGAFIAEIR